MAASWFCFALWFRLLVGIGWFGELQAVLIKNLQMDLIENWKLTSLVDAKAVPIESNRTEIIQIVALTQIRRLFLLFLAKYFICNSLMCRNRF